MAAGTFLRSLSRSNRAGGVAAQVRYFLTSSQSLAAAGAAMSVGSQIDLSAPATLQKARSWDEGVSSKFSTSSLADVFKGRKVVIFGLPGAFTGVCTNAHVPGYVARLEEFRSKGVDAIICTAVNDPYTLQAWAQKMGAADRLEFLADFDGSFHKLLGLDMDLSAALLGHRSQRWAALVEDGTVRVLEVEESPADHKLSSADHILGKI